MISKRDLQLGKIALRAGMVTKDQITRCLALKKKLAAEKGKNVSLGALLIKKGWLTEAQLEELVKLHNAEAGDDAGEASGEAPAPRKKKGKKKGKKKATASTDDASEASGEATATATRSEAPSEAPPSEAPSEASSGDDHGRNGGGSRGAAEAARKAADEDASAEEGAEAAAKARPKSGKTGRREKDAEKGKSGRGKKKADEAEAGDSDAGGVESAVESAVESGKGGASDVDPAVFQSAPESAVDEEDRRLIACPECGKKYRVREAQQGKRFTCRRCRNKVKVPKDLFARPLEGKKKGKGDVAVEEFTLGSSDQTSSEAPAGDDQGGEAKKGSVRSAAVKAAVAIQKVQQQTSIADLAKAAATHQKKGLPPRRRFGLAQALTLGACVATLAGIVGGGVAYKQHLAARAEEEKAALARVELDAWKKKVTDLLDRADPAIKARQTTELGNLLSDLQSRLKERDTLVRGNNQAEAEEWIKSLGLPARQQAILLAQAEGFAAAGTTVGAEDELRTLLRAADLARDDEALAVTLGRKLIRAGRTAEAAQRLGEGGTPAVAALAGLAFERGGAAPQAAKAYAKVPGAFGQALAARAQLADRGVDRALDAVAKATGLAGAELAAMKLVEAQALEMRDDRAGALRAAGEAVAAAGKELPWPKALEGELLLRGGKAQEALAAFQAANQAAGTARGFLGVGDALASLLDLDRARAAWNDAAAAPVVPQGAPLAPGDVDPFEAPFAPDPRALARCRIAALDVAAGRPQPAREGYARALALDPFCLEAVAGLAVLDISEGNLPLADGPLQGALARLRRQGGAERECVRSPTAATVLVARAAWLIESGRPADAAEVLGQAVAADPAVAPQAAALRGRLFEAQSQHTRAFEAFTEAAQLEVQVTFPAGRPFAAATALLEGAPDAPGLERVLAGVTATLAANPWHARAYLVRARVLVAQGKAPQALGALDRAIALNSYLRDAFVARGYLYVRDLPATERTRETAVKAAEDFQLALRIEQRQGGERAETHCGLALVALSQNDLLSAHTSATKALELDGRYAEAFKVRALVRARQGNAAGAKEDEAKAAALAKG